MKIAKVVKSKVINSDLSQCATIGHFAVGIVGTGMPIPKIQRKIDCSLFNGIPNAECE